MKRLILVVFTLGCLGFASVKAFQRPTPTVIGGATSTGTLVSMLTDSDGRPITSALAVPATISGSSIMTLNITSLNSVVYNISTGAANLYGISAFNAHTSACYIQIFDAAAANVTLGSTAPTISIPVSTVDDVNFISPVPFYSFATRMSAASTTLQNNSTTCTTSTTVTFYYR